jgi:hypothetical protein
MVFDVDATLLRRDSNSQVAKFEVVACILMIYLTVCVTQIGSHQFKVSPNDLIYTEKLKYCDINDKVFTSSERDWS